MRSCTGSQEEKQRVEEIRSFFIGNSDNVRLLNREVNKLLWPNQNTPGKSETAPNNVNLQQIEAWVGENPNVTIKEMRIRIQRLKYQQINSTPPYAKDEILIYYTKTGS